MTFKTLKTFEERIDKKKNGCWEWTGAKFESGYGSCYHKKKNMRAHRVSYEKYKGEIHNNLCVLHTCDNPSCVNPEHLYLGTQKENMRDRQKRGRGADNRGEKSPRSILTEKQVHEIKKLLTTNKTQKEIAALFNISESTIGAINTGRLWAHVSKTQNHKK